MNKKMNANKEIALSLHSKNGEIDCISKISDYMPLDDGTYMNFLKFSN